MSNIVLTNGVKIDNSSIADRIDVNNILAALPNLPYTATQDCVTFASCYSAYYHEWKVDNVGIFRQSFVDSYATFGLFIPLRKGQSISVPGRTHQTVFGLK